ncbi:hypothetical protein GGG16DRAFT_116526 [Schizophyllum commune]
MQALQKAACCASPASSAIVALAEEEMSGECRRSSASLIPSFSLPLLPYFVASHPTILVPIRLDTIDCSRDDFLMNSLSLAATEAELASFFSEPFATRLQRPPDIRRRAHQPSSVTAPSPPSSSSSATRKHLLSSSSTAPLALEFDLGVRPRTPLATTLTTLRDVDVDDDDDDDDDDGDLVEHDLAVRGIDALIALDAERGLTGIRARLKDPSPTSTYL